MRITTVYPRDHRGPGFLAWFVRSTLEGLAVGAHPAFDSWKLPPLYESGVRFRLEDGHGTGQEEFDLPPTTYRRGWGDCDDLVLWRLLELWQGVDPRELLSKMGAGQVARVRCEWDGYQMHVLIRLANGKLEDPSRRLDR